MGERTYTLRDPRTQRQVPVVVRRDKRLKKSARWMQRPDGSLVVRIPYRFPWREVPQLLKEIEAHLDRLAQQAARRTDEELAQRAWQVNRKYFGRRVPWVAIRWVSNMEKRLGSVTLGGNTHGHIRLSAKIQTWPAWVVDYVIAHEFTHLLLPEEGHSARFWETLQQAYPLTERARGFIKGYFFAKGEAGWEEDAL